MKLDALKEAARAHNIELLIHRITSGAEIAAAIEMAQASGAAALSVLASPILYASCQPLWTASQQRMYQWPEAAEEGGFVGYGPRVIELGGRPELAGGRSKGEYGRQRPQKILQRCRTSSNRSNEHHTSPRADSRSPGSSH